MHGLSYEDELKMKEKKLDEAFDKIKAHKYKEGLALLEEIPEKTARWYYISGYAHSCMGRNIVARDMITQAVNMEPDNAEYTRFLSYLTGSIHNYQESEHGTAIGKDPIHTKDEGCLGCCGYCCLSSFIDSCDCIDV